MAPANPSLLSALLLCCSLRHAAAGEVSITLNRPGLPVTRDALTIFSPAMESHGPVTSHTTVTLPQPVVVSVVGACASLSPAASELVGKTALVLNTAACDGHGAGAILGLLAAGQDATSGSGEILAVLGHDDPHGDAPEPNWSALPSSIQPTFLHNRHGHVYSVPVAWATQLRDVLAPLGGADGVALSVTPIVTPLAVGVPVEGSAYAHHMAYYSFVNPTPTDHDGSVILTVTPTVGDPDLYVNQGAAPEAIPLPAAFQGGSDAQQTSPGDDAMGLTLPAACVIGVWGSSGFASNFSILASTPSTSVPLLSGKPRRFEMRTAGEVRYFTIRTTYQPESSGVPQLAVAVTPLSGDPDLYISMATDKPGASSSQWSSLDEGNRYEHVLIRSADAEVASRCGGSAASHSCDFHIAVSARTPTIFSIVATAAGEKVRLVDGIPQAAQLPEGGGDARFVVRASSTHTDLTLSLAMQYGSSHLYVHTDALDPTPLWTSETLGTGDERLLIPSTDPNFCVLCDYYVRVSSTAAAGFSLTATSSDAVLLLEEGTPVTEAVSSNGYAYFKLYVAISSADVQVLLSAFSGDPDVYLSTTIHRPNATHHDFSSEDHASSGDVISLPHDNPKLALCTSGPNVCVLYVSVHGHNGPSSFSLTVSATDVSDGFRVDAPASIAGEYAFMMPTFGPRLPRHPISACVAYTEPHDACRPLSDAVAGCFALIDRGSSTAGPDACSYPDIYFANKIMRAQQAGAVGVLVADNAPSSGLTAMGAVNGDQAASVNIPSIFISQATGDVLKAALGNGLRVSLQKPAGRLTMLVPGVPLRGYAGVNQFRYYQLWTGPGHDALTLTLSASFGDPDLFISADALLPNAYQYTWSSRDRGGDSITLSTSDPKFLPNRIYYVGVLASASSTAYTITTSVAETLVTLLAGVPLANQEVAAGSYKYFRFFVDSSNAGITLAITAPTGDADIFAAFDVERPSSANHTWGAVGRATCYTVSCGPSIVQGDAIHIPPNDPRFCPRSPCLLYIGVRGQSNTTFSLLATISDDEANPISLSDGAAVQATLAHAGEYARFEFSTGEGTESIEIDIAASSGDPDLYVFAGTPSWPSRDDYTWSSTSSAGETLRISSHGPGGCVACTYHIVVYAWQSTAFSISATSTLGLRLLSDGVPAGGTADAATLKYFTYNVRAASQIDVFLTLFSGDASLYAKFTPPPFATYADDDGGPDRPLVDSATWAAAATVGTKALSVRPTSSYFCAPPCTLYIGVWGESNATFSLLLTQRTSSVVTLLGGQPQAGVVARGARRYYSISLNMSRGLYISLTATTGTPDVLYTYTGGPVSSNPATPTAAGALPLPTDAAHSDGSLDASYMLAVAPRNGHATYIFGVGGVGGAANFSLLARPGSSMTRLVDGVPTQAEVFPSETSLFRLSVPASLDSAVEPLVAVTALRGSVEVLLGLDGEPPTAASHAAAVTATPAKPAVLALTPGAVNILGASRAASSATAGGSSAASVASFSLLPMLGGGAAQLLDGRQQAVHVGANQYKRFHFVTTSSQRLISISASTLGLSADNVATQITIYASLAPDPVTAWADGVHGRDRGWRARGEEGEAASMSLVAGTQEGLLCDGTCVLHVELVATAPSDVVLTASSQAAATQLPVGQQSCGAVRLDELFSLVALPDAEAHADSRLTLGLEVCSGSAEMYASAHAMPTLTAHIDYSSTGVPPPPIAFPASALSAGSTAFAAVRGLQVSSSFCVWARPSGQPPRQATLPAATAAVHLSPLSSTASISLTFTPLDGLGEPASAAPSAPPIAGTYEVWAGEETESAVFYTWCGLARSAKRAASAKPSDLIPQPDAHASVGGRPAALKVAGLTVSVPPNFIGLPMFEAGKKHKLTLVAILPSLAPGEDARPRRLVYPPVDWTPIAPPAPSGGGSAFGTLFLVLLFVGGPIGSVLYLHRRGADLRTPDGRSKALYIVGAAAAALAAKLTALAAMLAARVGGGGRPSRPTRRVVIGGEAMSAPLAMHSFAEAAPYDHAPLAMASPFATPAAAAPMASPLSAAAAPQPSLGAMMAYSVATGDHPDREGTEPPRPPPAPAAVAEPAATLTPLTALPALPADASSAAADGDGGGGQPKVSERLERARASAAAARERQAARAAAAAAAAAATSTTATPAAGAAFDMDD